MHYTVEVDTLEEKSVIPCSRWNDHHFDKCFTQKRITQSITIIATKIRSLQLYSRKEFYCQGQQGLKNAGLYGMCLFGMLGDPILQKAPEK